MKNVTIALMVAAAFTTAGCKKKEGDAPKAGSGSAAVTPPTPAPDASAGAGSGSGSGSGSATAGAYSGPPVGEGPVVLAKTLVMHDLPIIKGAPATAKWVSPQAVIDGRKLTNLKDGSTGYISMTYEDCNLPMIKEYAAKPASEQAHFVYCFRTPAADGPKIKNYPRLDKDEEVVIIKVGHVIILAAIWANQMDKIKKDDLVAFLETVDFSAIEK